MPPHQGSPEALGVHLRAHLDPHLYAPSLTKAGLFDTTLWDLAGTEDQASVASASLLPLGQP